MASDNLINLATRLRKLRSPNLTLRKMYSFATVNGVGAAILFAIQYPLVEWGGVHYIPATIIAGAVAFLVKFVLAGVFTYRQ